MTLTKTPLTGDQVLIDGTDVRNQFGSMIVDSSQWEGIKRHAQFHEALELVDAAIETLVAPIQAAMDAANEIGKAPELDPLLYYVEREGVEGTESVRPIVSKLNPDSVILRALEEGLHNRLIWVNDRLVLTAAPVSYVSAPPAPPVTPTSFGD
jgi:hypothetical protein